MEVKNTFKKVGDFQKGKKDLDVNINNKKLIITESGNKNMTLNKFVFNRNDKEENKEKEKDKEKDMSSYINEESLYDINLHKNQIRRKMEISPIKKDNNISKDEINETDEINTNAFDEISNPFIKANLEDIDIEEDNIPTKIKNNTKKKNVSKKNKDKVPFKTILDYFN